MSFRIETQPSTELCTVDEVKSVLRLDTTADDVQIVSLITAAREIAERTTRRSLVYKGYVYYRDSFPTMGYYLDHTQAQYNFAQGNRFRDPEHSAIRIPCPPLISVESVLYLDTNLNQQTWDPSQYYVSTSQEPGVIITRPGCVYPVVGFVPNAVEIHLHAGYGFGGYGDDTRECPEFLRLAIMKLAAHWYDHPEMITPDGVHEVPQGVMDMFLGSQIHV